MKHLLSIGFYRELKPGAEVVHFYFTKKELKMLLSFLEIYAHFTSTFTPILSDNVTFKVNKYGIPFINCIQDLKINGIDIDDWNGLIHIETNKFVSNNVDPVKKFLMK